MAFVAIPNNNQYEYDNAPPDPGVGHPRRALWLKSSNGIRTDHSHSVYVRCRRIGSGDVDHGELSKSFWDARGTEDDIQPFAMTVRTTAANEAFTIPCQNVGTFNATIDWGDGSSSTVTTYNDSNLAHTYASAGDHAISISGTLPNIYFNNTGDRTKVISVTNLGQVGWQTLERAFRGCSNMTSFTPGVTDTSSVTTMHRMFYSCTSLTSLDVSSFDTSSVTNMAYMISNCSSLTSLDVSSFDTSSVTAIEQMFYGCSDLTSLDVSSFDTSSITTMERMFYGCSSLTSLDLSSFDTSSVTNMQFMFGSCSDLTSLDLSSFDTSSVTTMSYMFYGCSSLTSLDLSSFDTSSVTNISNMFTSCSNLTSLDLSNFDTSSATNMSYMFNGCSNLTSVDVSSFDTSSVTNMSAVFSNCSSLTSLDLSNFDTSSATNMQFMFGFCTSLTDIVGVENFNIEALNSTASLSIFMISVTIPTARYDALLVNWDAQDPLDNMTPNFGNSKYTAGGTAAAARANLISTDGWTITDGGTA